MSGYTSTKKGIDAKKVILTIYSEIQALAREFAGPNPKGQFCLEDISENSAEIVYRQKGGFMKKDYEHTIAMAENNYSDGMLPVNRGALITGNLLAPLELCLQMAAGKKGLSEEEGKSLHKKLWKIQENYMRQMRGE